MLIRDAKLEDVPALVQLGKLAHNESPRYAHIKFDANAAADTTASLLQNQWALVLVAELDGEIVGCMAGMVMPYFFSRDYYGSDFFFYVAEGSRGRAAGVRLLARWDEILRADGRVVESSLGISSEIATDRTVELYERLGYRKAGHLMVKRYV